MYKRQAGGTPKSWNNKILTNEHVKVEYYEQDSSKVFSGTDIKGGVAIIYQDNNNLFEPIDTFTPVSYTHLDVYKRQLVGGFLAGGIVLFLRKYIKVPRSLEGVKSILLLPLFCLLYTSRCV